MSDGYKFTEDWFSWAPSVWEQLSEKLPQRRYFLEVGSYEGRSMVWMAENMADPDFAYIFCIDTWAGGEEHGAHDMAAVEERFDHNRQLIQTRYPELAVRKCKGKSSSHLAGLQEDYEGMFDFVYIDGSHIARDVLTDACMAWPLLRKGGVLVFDDYLWGAPRDLLHRPKVAVDAFMNIFAEELEPLHLGYQAAIRKKGG